MAQRDRDTGQQLGSSGCHCQPARSLAELTHPQVLLIDHVKFVLAAIGFDAEDRVRRTSLMRRFPLRAASIASNFAIGRFVIELKHDPPVGLHAGFRGQLPIGGPQLARTCKNRSRCSVRGSPTRTVGLAADRFEMYSHVRVSAAGHAQLDLEKIEHLGVLVEIGRRHANFPPFIGRNAVGGARSARTFASAVALSRAFAVADRRTAINGVEVRRLGRDDGRNRIQRLLDRHLFRIGGCTSPRLGSSNCCSLPRSCPLPPPPTSSSTVTGTAFVSQISRLDSQIKNISNVIDAHTSSVDSSNARHLVVPRARRRRDCSR